MVGRQSGFLLRDPIFKGKLAVGFRVRIIQLRLTGYGTSRVSKASKGIRVAPTWSFLRTWKPRCVRFFTNPFEKCAACQIGCHFPAKKKCGDNQKMCEIWCFFVYGSFFTCSNLHISKICLPLKSPYGPN